MTRIDSSGGWLASVADLARFASAVRGVSGTPEILRPGRDPVLHLPGVLQTAGPFGIGDGRTRLRLGPAPGCGCSSGVEHNLAKVGVVGSNPIARSNSSNVVPDVETSGDGTMPRWPLSLPPKLLVEPRVVISGAAATADAFLPSLGGMPVILVDGDQPRRHPPPRAARRTSRPAPRRRLSS